MYLNAVHEVGTITGSTITLSGTEVAGGQTFAAAGATAGPVYTVRVSALSDSTTWAVCLATYSTGSLTITETVESSGSFGAGTPVSVFSTIRASVLENADLSAIAGSLSATAVDLFLYDTSEDDDPNWVNDASKSWYTETLNTATRGATRPFPRLALLVLEASKLTIYDATDPSLPMWMVFTGGANTMLYYNGAPHNSSCVAAKNGGVYVGNDTYDVRLFDFVSDLGKRWQTIGFDFYKSNIAGRNTSSQWSGVYTGSGIVNRAVNDIALTILPDTPIDPIRNMRTPTVAVGTDGGVSVIHADGTVVDITGDAGATYSYAEGVAFIGSDITFGMDAQSSYGKRTQFRVPIPTSDRTVVSSSSTATDKDASSGGSLPHPLGNSGYCHRLGNDFFAMTGLSRLAEFPDDPLNAAIAYITSTYNTGWMHGDIKGAWLADTTAETVGVDESTELVTNGTFDTDTTGWTAGTGTVPLSVVAGALRVQNDGTNYGYASQAIACEVGKQYVLNLDIIYSAGYARAAVGGAPGTPGTAQINVTASGNYSWTFTATQTTMYVNVGNRSDTDVYNDFDNISVIRTGNLIENGDFTYSTAGWTSGQDAVLSVSAGRLRVTNNVTDYGYAYQAFDTVVGNVYTLTADGFIGDAGNIRVSIGTAPKGTSLGTGNRNVDETFVFTFVATTTQTYVTLLNNSTGDATYAEFDNVSVRLADPDRSVNNKGLAVHGEITKAPVATGADLVAYSGFGTSGNNYLEMPADASIDFSTGDYHIIGWVKPDSWAGRTFIDIFNASNQGVIVCGYGGNLRVFCYSGASNVAATVASSLPTGGWTQIVVRRSNTNTFDIFVNGSSVFSGTLVLYHSPAGPMTIRVAKNITGTGPFGANVYPGGNQEMALWRVAKTAPTADQIRAFYADEKPLFQANAKCTLPGSSDVVNCLAYNEWRDTLHVGTGAGKATFKGLVNVSEDTTAAVTKIAVLGEYEVTD